MRNLVTSALIFLVANSSLVQAETKEPIKIGVLTSLSDEWSAMGQATVRGVQLALSEINASGGIDGRPLELVVEDTQEANSGARAVTAFRALRQRGIQWFIGPGGTPAGLSLAPIVASDSVVMITPTVGLRNFSDAGTNIFNSRGVDEQASSAMAEIAFRDGWRRAGVISSQQPWESAQGEAFRKRFEELGGRITALESPLPDTNDFRIIVAKLLSKNPDGIFLSNYNRLAIVAKQLVQAGYKGPKVTTVLDNSILQAASGSLEGARFASFVGPIEAFREKFIEKYGGNPDLGADTGYDAAYALAIALRSESPTTSKVSEKLKTVSFEGAAGAFSFGADRIASRPLKKFVVENSRIKGLNEG